jgi:predicted nucleic acid-binding protein
MIFVDTSGWYATEVEDDTNHSLATDFLKKIVSNRYGALVTSDYVLDETLTLIRARRGVKVAIQFLEKIRKSRNLTLVWIDKDVFDKAADLFEIANQSQVWSFTDCTSFSIMKDLGITDAYSFDSDFRTAGFHVLP